MKINEQTMQTLMEIYHGAYGALEQFLLWLPTYTDFYLVEHN